MSVFDGYSGSGGVLVLNISLLGEAIASAVLMGIDAEVLLGCFVTRIVVDVASSSWPGASWLHSRRSIPKTITVRMLNSVVHGLLFIGEKLAHFRRLRLSFY